MKKSAVTISPVMRKLSEYIAAAPRKALPAPVVERAKHHVLDTIAAMVSGAPLLPGRRAIEYVGTLGGTPEAGIVGSRIITSAANAALDTLRSLHFPTPAGDWHSAAVLSKGDYGITPGIMFGYPLRTQADGSWEIVQGLPLDAFSKEKIAFTEKELLEERATAAEALGLQL